MLGPGLLRRPFLPLIRTLAHQSSPLFSPGGWHIGPRIGHLCALPSERHAGPDDQACLSPSRSHVQRTPRISARMSRPIPTTCRVSLALVDKWRPSPPVISDRASHRSNSRREAVSAPKGQIVPLWLIRADGNVGSSVGGLWGPLVLSARCHDLSRRGDPLVMHQLLAGFWTPPPSHCLSWSAPS
jgi:hypothetical protein